MYTFNRKLFIFYSLLFFLCFFQVDWSMNDKAPGRFFKLWEDILNGRRGSDQIGYVGAILFYTNILALIALILGSMSSAIHTVVAVKFKKLDTALQLRKKGSRELKQSPPTG